MNIHDRSLDLDCQQEQEKEDEEVQQENEEGGEEEAEEDLIRFWLCFLLTSRCA